MLYKRDILAKIKPFLKQNIIILLIGARQVGKTSLLRLLEQEVIQNQLASKQQILYFDLESFADLKTITQKDYKEFAVYLYDKTGLAADIPLYIFIDEIQYLSNPTPLFKLLADHYPQIHLLLSGSSSLEVKKMFTDRLTGRKVLFHIKPLSFTEYARFQEHELVHLLEQKNTLELLAGDTTQINKLKNFSKEFLSLYEQMVLYGSFPRPSLKSQTQVRETFLKEISNTYLRKDISDILRVENISGFNTLLELLATQIGNLINIQELATSTRLNRLTVEKYLWLMQETYIYHLVRPYFSNQRQELVKMPKGYMHDTGVRNSLLNNFQPLQQRSDKGSLIENMVGNQLLQVLERLRFWRSKAKAEVDFIIEFNSQLIPIEVKYRTFNKPQIPSGLSSFIDRYQPQRAFVVTRDYLAQTKHDNTQVYFIPAFYL